jgi:hypothetical protein
MFPVRYELGLYIPEDGILHRPRHKNLKIYIAYHVYLQRHITTPTEISSIFSAVTNSETN